MGVLRDFDLPGFGCDVFFETGTGRGHGLAYALACGCFERLYSVEVDPAAYEAARALFALFPQVTLLHSASPSALREALPEIGRERRVLFFLDAHFPGETTSADLLAPYKADAAPLLLRLPLEQELEAIRALRDGCDDVIIADDLRIYEDGPFESGNMPEWAETLKPEQKSAAFVQRLFPRSVIERQYRREGYLIVKSP